ncbi:MAG TPA: hypothetical protein VI911_09030 [Patescibacteria group bacterium]|nr:MAG: hypothetical protein UR43_C0005G0026 [candidate division TM6 bacterium GW2011_GWF2_33_332]HLD91141.1 hypothetical protein [Patescibacteria group bacterium]
MLKYIVNKDTINLCKQFALDSVESSLDEYSKRNQSNKELIIQQIFEGKVAEFAVYQYYKDRQLDCTLPDISIYTKRKKSFSSDLQVGMYHIHVKSQNLSSQRRYGKSWLFQAKDPLFKKATEYDICVFCTVDENVVTIELKDQFVNLTFSEPKLDKLKGNKKAFYLD